MKRKWWEEIVGFKTVYLEQEMNAWWPFDFKEY